MSEKKPDDLIRAKEFLGQVSEKLELDPEIIEEVMPYLLGMTKHIAHGAVRPAAPLAAFLVGLSAQKADVDVIKQRIAEVEEAVKGYRDGKA